MLILRSLDNYYKDAVDDLEMVPRVKTAIRMIIDCRTDFNYLKWLNNDENYLNYLKNCDYGYFSEPDGDVSSL